MVKLVTVVKMVLSGLQLCRCRPKQRQWHCCATLLTFHSGSLMKLFSSVLLCSGALLVLLSSSVSGHAPESTAAAGPTSAFAMRPAKTLRKRVFSRCPIPSWREEHLAHVDAGAAHGGDAEDEATAKYVAAEVSRRGTRYGDCRVQGLDQLSAGNQRGHNRARWSRNARPTREHVDGDAYDEDPRVGDAVQTAWSPSGDAEAEWSMPTTARRKILKSWRS